MTSAENRTALITGGAKGIGLACATAFGNAGFNVKVLGRDLVALKACGFEYEVCDVTSESEVSATLARIGQVDILVNNAGIARQTCAQGAWPGTRRPVGGKSFQSLG